MTKKLTTRKSGPNTARQSGGRFAEGNSGKPRGARHRVTIAIESLLEGDAEKLTRKAIDLALGGDSTALRLCMERLAPARKSRPVSVAIPSVVTAADSDAAMTAIIAAVASGEIDPDEAAALVAIIEAKRRSLETTNLAERIVQLEKAAAERKPA